MPNNSKVIHIIVITVCLCALIGVGTEAFCYIFKVPDMNTTLSGGFMHVVDTLIGALIAMLINTRPQEQAPPAGAGVKITNPPSEPVPVKPEGT